MAKTANLYARIEPEIKDSAEEVLEMLGLSASAAINMFYKQLIFRQGLPFEVKIPSQSSEPKEAEVKTDSTKKEENFSKGGKAMKQFIIVDDNVPMQFFGNCVGCILDKRYWENIWRR